jgi:hypothetical protein
MSQVNVNDFSMEYEYDAETEEMKVWVYDSHFNTQFIIDRDDMGWLEFCTHCRVVADSQLRNMIDGVNILVSTGLSVVEDDDATERKAPHSWRRSDTTVVRDDE